MRWVGYRLIREDTHWPSRTQAHTHSHTHADTRTQAHKPFKQSKPEAPLMCFLSKCVWKYTCVLENYPLVNYEGVYGGVYGKVDVEIRHRDAQTDQTLLTV